MMEKVSVYELAERGEKVKTPQGFNGEYHSGAAFRKGNFGKTKYGKTRDGVIVFKRKRLALIRVGPRG